MPKNIDKLGKLEDFSFNSLLTADEPDMEKLRKYVFGLLQDKARAQDARDLAQAETAKVEEERDGLKDELASKADPDFAKKLEKAEQERDEAKRKLADRETLDLAVEVAEEKGLTAKQASYLKGTTKEELEKSADKFIEDNGIEPKASEDGDDDDDDDESNSLRRTPRRLTNPADDKNGKGPDKALDIDSIVADWDTRSL